MQVSKAGFSTPFKLSAKKMGYRYISRSLEPDPFKEKEDLLDLCVKRKKRGGGVLKTFGKITRIRLLKYTQIYWNLRNINVRTLLWQCHACSVCWPI